MCVIPNHNGDKRLLSHVLHFTLVVFDMIIFSKGGRGVCRCEWHFHGLNNKDNKNNNNILTSVPISLRLTNVKLRFLYSLFVRILSLKMPNNYTKHCQNCAYSNPCASPIFHVHFGSSVSSWTTVFDLCVPHSRRHHWRPTAQNATLSSKITTNSFSFSIISIFETVDNQKG